MLRFDPGVNSVTVKLAHCHKVQFSKGWNAAQNLHSAKLRHRSINHSTPAIVRDRADSMAKTNTSGAADRYVSVTTEPMLQNGEMRALELSHRHVRHMGSNATAVCSKHCVLLVMWQLCNWVAVQRQLLQAR